MSGGLSLAVLISGRGSNLQALIDACADPAFPARISLVISNNPDAAGLARAAAAHIPTAVINHRDYADKAGFEAALHTTLSNYPVDFICLAGFMRILGASFIQKWENRILNIHPSLLPAYKGLDTHARAIADGQSAGGCTVHYVTAGIDDGPVILQEAVPILPGDSAETLAARVLPVEHRLYPAAIAHLARTHLKNR
jgi:phosphoribosylglycinamide formyltransferase-1